MRLVLASSPFKNKKIIKKIINLTGKNRKDISVAVIMEAHCAEDEHRWVIRGLKRIAKTFGGSIQLLNLFSMPLSDIKNRIENVDIIWCLGGSTDFLMQSFIKSGFIKMLPEILKTKVWVGSSAGSCVLGARNSIEEDTKFYPAEKYYDVSDFMRIVNAYLYPHFWSGYTLPAAEQNLIEASKSYNIPVYALSDKSAYLVEDDKEYLFGKKAVKIVKGEIIERI